MIDFTNINYLEIGNAKQQAVFRLFTKYRIFQILESYQPILAGTIPIEIDIDSSDLDILCHVANIAEFKEILQNEFANHENFEMHETLTNGSPTIICRFVLENFPIEIFGQNKASDKQQAYRHLLIEYRLLQEKGNDFRQKIIALKQQGIKTEPAFALLLGLSGNPYEALLEIE